MLAFSKGATTAGRNGVSEENVNWNGYAGLLNQGDLSVLFAPSYFVQSGAVNPEVGVLGSNNIFGYYSKTVAYRDANVGNLVLQFGAEGNLMMPTRFGVQYVGQSLRWLHPLHSLKVRIYFVQARLYKFSGNFD